MTGRRTGLRKTSKKSMDSSTENLQSTCESTAESESELNIAIEEPLGQNVQMTSGMIITDAQRGTPTQNVTELDPDATPVQSELMKQVHDAIQCRTAESQLNQTEQSVDAPEPSRPNICRTLPTKTNTGNVWVMTCPTNALHDDDQTAVLQRLSETQVSNANQARDVNMPTLQRQNARIVRDAECAAGLLLTDAQAVLQQEQEKQRLDEASKLCMTNREMFEERERVARYILDAPPKEARIVQQQLNQALEEYQNKPTNRLAKPIYRARAMATPSADAQQDYAAAPTQQPPRRLRRLSSLEDVRQRPVDINGNPIAAAEERASCAPLGSHNAANQRSSSEQRAGMLPYNPMRIKSPAGRTVDQTRRAARRAEYDRVFGKPAYDNYPSSDTDCSEAYTTSQEDEALVEHRFAGGISDDWREWPWRKLRLGEKMQKRRAKADNVVNLNVRQNANRQAQQSDRQTIIDLTTAERLRQLEDAMVRTRNKLAESEKKRQFEQNKRRNIETTLCANKPRNRNVPSGDDDIYATAYEDIETADEQTVQAKPAPQRSQGPTRTMTLRSDQRNRSNNAETRARAKTSAPVKFMGNAPGAATAVSSTSRTACPGEIALEVPTFTGGNWATFLNQFENVAEYYNWTEREKAVCLHNAIRGEAANALSVADSKHWPFNKLVEHMEMRHGRNRSYGDVVVDLMSQVRRTGQDLSAWHDQVQNVVNTGNLTEEQERLTAFFGFVYGLRYRPALFNKVLSRVARPTLEDAFYQAKLFEKDNGSQGYSDQFNLPVEVNVLRALEPSAEQKKQVAKDPVAAMAHAVEAYKAPQGDSWAPAVEKLMEHITSVGNRLEKKVDNIDERVRQLERTGKNENAGNFRGRGRGFRGGFRNYDQRQISLDNQNERRDFNGNYRPREESNDRDNYPRRGGFRGRGRGRYPGRGGGPPTQDSRQDQRNNDNDNGRRAEPGREQRAAANAGGYQE